jgi:transcriptional regulator with XRE-family HTH domain
MKQPDLGKKIAFLRKEKGLTQEELVERCCINVRTIQRIESGEVIPRPITLRLILEALDYDFEMLNAELKANDITTSFFSLNWLRSFFLLGFDPSKNLISSAKILQYAWIAGLVAFLIGFPESGMEYAQYYHRFDSNLNLIYVLVKIVSFIALVIMMRGFIIIGDFHHNYLMKISSYLIIIHSLFTAIYYVASVYFPQLQSEHADGGVAITYGAILLLFGISLQKIRPQFGKAAGIAGIIAVIASILFITLILWWVGLLLLIPIEILEIVILYKGYEMFLKNVSESRIS